MLFRSQDVKVPDDDRCERFALAGFRFECDDDKSAHDNSLFWRDSEGDALATLHPIKRRLGEDLIQTGADGVELGWIGRLDKRKNDCHEYFEEKEQWPSHQGIQAIHCATMTYSFALQRPSHGG